MADSIHTSPEPTKGTTRRGFLGHAAGAATAAVLVKSCAGTSTDLHALLDRYKQATAQWFATEDTVGDIAAVGPEYEAAWKACKNVLFHQCRSHDEVQEKLRIVAADNWLSETAKDGSDHEDGYIYDRFIQSLTI